MEDGKGATNSIAANRKRRILIILLVLALAVAAAWAAYSAVLKGRNSGSDPSGSEGKRADAQTEETVRSGSGEDGGADGTARTEGAEDGGTEKPLCTLVFASDYQPEDGFPAPAETLAKLLQAAKADGKAPDNVIICGDYSNRGRLYDHQISPDRGIAEARDVIGSECPEVPQEDLIFVQGNHDALTDEISESGLHEYGGYLVYVINTQYDFPWCQGTTVGSKEKVEDAAARLRETLDDLVQKGETRPLIIAGHVPLHYTARTSSRHSTGDNLYASYIFDAVNDAAKDLDIIYLFGHNHSKGWDCYLGGSCVFRQPGETILIPEEEGGKATTDVFSEETLNFTYMNAGYTGYYMNCAAGDYSSDSDSPYRAADETLTCTAAEIYDDRIVITRYDTEGRHVLGAAGEADPFKGGIDEGLIGPEYYSKENAGPVTLKRKRELS